MTSPIRLTQYSHGAGCGCKISPKVLDVILAGSGAQHLDPRLWVGNASRDDAAVYALDGADGQRGVVSTTDFFMPIVDDPFDFGRIAATNAISDIYAMGGDPLMAIAILGWPVNVLPPEVAREVVAGGRRAVTTLAFRWRAAFDRRARAGLRAGGDWPGGTRAHEAQRHRHAWLPAVPDQAAGHRRADHGGKRLLRADNRHLARDWMCVLNRPGSAFGRCPVCAR